MIKTLAVVSVSAMIVMLMGCSLMAKNKTEEFYADSEIRVYEVYGMDCPACASGLDKLVEKIPSVGKSEADWKGKKLKVTVKPGDELQDEDIFDAINKANFTPGKRIQ